MASKIAAPSRDGRLTGVTEMAERYVTRQALVDPGSPSAESFRTLRLALQLRAKSDLRSAVLVTSAEPGAGKSTIASNFAMVSALAHAERGAHRRRLAQAGAARDLRAHTLTWPHRAARERRGDRRLRATGCERSGRAHRRPCRRPRESDVSASPRMVEVLTEAAPRNTISSSSTRLRCCPPPTQRASPLSSTSRSCS